MPKKQKVLNVTYRKDSVTFDDYMKYEITLIDEEGKTQVIPAYGKDLQDALSRVVHDKRVHVIRKTSEKVPMAVWLLLWFTYLGMLSIGYMYTQNPLVYMGGLLGGIMVVLSLGWWGRSKNREIK